MNGHRVKALIVEIFQGTGITHVLENGVKGRPIQEVRLDDLVRLTPERVRGAARWQLHVGEAVKQETLPIEPWARPRTWENDRDGDLEVLLEDTVEVLQGVQRVAIEESNWQRTWEVGGSAGFSYEASAEAGVDMGIVAKASVTTSIHAEIEAKGGGTDGGRAERQRQEQEQRTTTRRLEQKLVVPPHKRLLVTANYDRTTAVYPWKQRLATNCGFTAMPMWVGDWTGGYKTTWNDWQGSDWHAGWPSLDAWLDGFVGRPPAGCDDFREGLDMTHTRDERELKVLKLVQAIREEMHIARHGTVEVVGSGGFAFKLREEAL